MILQSADKIFLSHRRLFERENARFFVGQVDAYESGIVRATGYTFIRDAIGGTIHRKEDRRTKLFSIVSGTLIVYVLPSGLDIELAQMVAHDGRVALTIGKGFRMDLSEAGDSAFTRVG